MLTIVRKALLLSLLAVGAVSAQSDEIAVGDVGVTGLKWGKQAIAIELTNQSEYPKFISSEIELKFSNTYLNTERVARSNDLLLPGETKTISPEVFIPGGIGKAEMFLRLYDVIDTLDELLDYQRFYEQPFILNLKIPDQAVGYYNKKITFPPRVESHPYFSSEFSRVFIVMLNEGKSLEEIAEINDCDMSYIKEVAKLFTRYNYISKTDNGYKLNFPVITEAEAEQARPIAERTADSLAKLLFDNYQRYDAITDSLIAAKAIPDDTNDFISGATLVNQPYAVLSGLELWYVLGRNFITRSAPFKNFDGTDICHAGNWQYMYTVVGGDYFNGTHFYGYVENMHDIDVLFAEHEPSIVCKDGFLEAHGVGGSTNWKYEYPHFPEFFVLDTVVMQPYFDQLSKHTQALLASTYEEIKANAIAFGHPKCDFAYRYWFWNLTATLTLNKLVDEYGVERRGEGHFRYDTMTRHLEE